MATIVNATIRDPSGNPLQGARVIARLSAVEYWNGVLVPQSVYAETGANGTCSLSLWPNSLGTHGTTYTISIQHPFVRPSLTYPNITVPDTVSLTLNQLLGETGGAIEAGNWDDTEVWSDNLMWTEQ